VFFQVYQYKHDGEAPLLPENLPEMLRIQVIPDPAECFVSSGIEKTLVADYRIIPNGLAIIVLINLQENYSIR
jgi:hypothetical protein